MRSKSGSSARREWVTPSGRGPTWTAACIVVVALAFAIPIRAAHAACAAIAPELQGLFLAGRSITEGVHALWADSAERRSALGSELQNVIVLDDELAKLNQSVWGTYWVALYHRRLHEVLDQLDPKTRDPAVAYYTRWSGSQLMNSATTVLQNVDRVRGAAARAGAVPQVVRSDLAEHLDRVARSLSGCAGP